MVRNTDREEMEYRKGYADARRSDSASGILGAIFGLIVVLALGAGAYFVFAGQSQQTDSPDIINVPAPEAPEAPDVDVQIPEPNVNIDGNRPWNSY